MKFIYILEDDERIQKDLFDTLKNIDPKLCIRFFPSLEHFHNWLRVAMTEGPKALAAGGTPFIEDTQEKIAPTSTDELRLVIAKNEFFGTQNMGLVKRAQEFFLRKKICSEQEPTALILTAFEGPEFDIRLAEDRVINNVIFKPFDKLILKGHLEYALKGHHQVSSDTISSIKITSTIEMLKEVVIQSLSEVGFTSINNHEIRIGSMSKYYGEIFKSGDKKSAMAYCKSCREISPAEFRCEFIFLGLDNEQISQIRRHILQNKSHTSMELKNTHGKTTQILILDEDESLSLELTQLINDKFSNAVVYRYSHNAQLLSDLADKDTIHRQNLPTQFDMVIANYEFLEAEKQKFWDNLCKLFTDRAAKAGLPTAPPPDLYLVSRRKIPAEEMRDLSRWTKDVFFTLFDKSYIYKKLITHRSTLLNKTPTTLASLPEDVALKVANPVEITEISEAGLVMKYYRAIGIGSFREFILWRPDELENPEIIGTVNYSEPNKDGDKGVFNHFVFFGMKDYYLKHIRLWLREAYIKAKDKS